MSDTITIADCSGFARSLKTVSALKTPNHMWFRSVRFDVLKHEQFEEICAAAAIGQASPEELAELERHASECDACRQDYAECLGMAARQFAAAERHLELSQQEATSCLNSEMLTKRFFERAEREGIVFSRGAAKSTSEIPPFLISFRHRSGWRFPVFSAAAA